MLSGAPISFHLDRDSHTAILALFVSALTSNKFLHCPHLCISGVLLILSDDHSSISQVLTLSMHITFLSVRIIATSVHIIACPRKGWPQQREYVCKYRVWNYCSAFSKQPEDSGDQSVMGKVDRDADLEEALDFFFSNCNSCPEEALRNLLWFIIESQSFWWPRWLSGTMCMQALWSPRQVTSASSNHDISSFGHLKLPSQLLIFAILQVVCLYLCFSLYTQVTMPRVPTG